MRIPKPRNPDSTSKHSQIPDSTKFESDHNVKLLPLLQLETSHIRFPLKQELWRKNNDNIQRGGGCSMGDRISGVLQSWARFVERGLSLIQDNAKF